MSAISDTLRIVSVAALAVFAGAMLTEGMVLVPYWRSLTPTEFFAWYAANDRRLLGFFGPLTSVTAVLAIAAAFFAFWEGHPQRWFSLLAALLSLAVVSTFFLYFEKANLSFATASLGSEQVAAELARWASWHAWRTLISFAALAAAMWSLRHS